MFKTILLATDGSAASERAADFAASLATRYGAQVQVLHAYTPLPHYLGEPNYSRALYKTLDEANAMLESVAARLREAGVSQVETDAIQGSPSSVILEAAEVRKPDLIVMGARGLSTWQGVVLGSVSMAVTQRAECPVLIVK
jgi:nucleotide-binding universal stress UspA family protein